MTDRPPTVTWVDLEAGNDIPTHEQRQEFLFSMQEHYDRMLVQSTAGTPSKAVNQATAEDAGTEVMPSTAQQSLQQKQGRH
jgi:hypothetical protein